MLLFVYWHSNSLYYLGKVGFSRGRCQGETDVMQDRRVYGNHQNISGLPVLRRSLLRMIWLLPDHRRQDQGASVVLVFRVPMAKQAVYMYLFPERRVCFCRAK